MDNSLYNKNGWEYNVDMIIEAQTIKVGRTELGWYVRSGNITMWCNSLEEALSHIIIKKKNNG